MEKSTWHILDLMNPSIHTVSLGRTQSQQIKSEMLWAGSITKFNRWITSLLMGNTKGVSLLPETTQKFGKWQHGWYVFIQSYVKTQILPLIITHLPFNNPVIPFCPAQCLDIFYWPSSKLIGCTVLWLLMTGYISPCSQVFIRQKANMWFIDP